jgi:hypothetical protein
MNLFILKPWDKSQGCTPLPLRGKGRKPGAERKSGTVKTLQPLRHMLSRKQRTFGTHESFYSQTLG